MVVSWHRCTVAQQGSESHSLLPVAHSTAALYVLLGAVVAGSVSPLLLRLIRGVVVLILFDHFYFLIFNYWLLFILAFSIVPIDVKSINLLWI